MLEAPVKPEEERQDYAIRDALERILQSNSFAGSPRLSQFLRYVVEHTLDGEVSELKETCIGVAVFGKRASYNPKEEPIVRVEARRLRARLEEYYSSTGQNDAIRIHLPKGGYLAHFLETTSPDPLPLGARLNESSDLPQIEPAQNLAQGKKSWLIAFYLTICLGLLAGSAFLFTHLLAAKPLRFIRIAPLTNYPGNESQPSISHDGKRLAFVWGGEKSDNYDVYVKLIDLGSPVHLTTNPGHDPCAGMVS